MFDSFYGFFAAYIPLVILAIIGVWNEDKLIRIEQKIKNRTQNEPIHSGGGSIRRNQTGFSIQKIFNKRKTKDGNTIFSHKFCIQCGKTLQQNQFQTFRTLLI